MKKRRRAILAVLSIVMIVVSSATIFADTYYTARNGNISLELPNDWTMEEIDSSKSEGYDYESILSAGSDLGKFQLDVYYKTDLAEEYIDVNGSEEEALAYYNDYGSGAVSELEDSITDFRSLKIGGSVCFQGETDNFIVVRPIVKLNNGEKFEDLIYLTAEMTDDGMYLVHNFMVFSKEDGSAITSKEEDIAQQIADSYYDYGYYNEYAGFAAGDDDYYYDDNTLEEDDGGIFALVGPLIIAIGAAAIKILDMKSKASPKPKKINSNIASKVKDDDLQLHTDKAPEYKKVKRQPMAQATKVQHGKAAKNTAKSKPAARTTIPQSKSQYTSSAEDRYINSLEVLKKSGLLTKEEMQEMINKHKRL